VYDPVSDRFVAWGGGAEVYTLDLDTLTWKTPPGGLQQGGSHAVQERNLRTLSIRPVEKRVHRGERGGRERLRVPAHGERGQSVAEAGIAKLKKELPSAKLSS
jgi:hypothetical protein